MSFGFPSVCLALREGYFHKLIDQNRGVPYYSAHRKKKPYSPFSILLFLDVNIYADSM